MGSKYEDHCDNSDCMSLLSIQVFVALLIKPIPRYITTGIIPFVPFLYLPGFFLESFI